jgi:hypothetical protein
MSDTLARGRAPHYVLIDTVQVLYQGQYITLPAGLYVRPVALKYIPTHLSDMSEHRYMNHDTHVFCYSKYGFLSLPRSLIKQE